MREGKAPGEDAAAEVLFGAALQPTLQERRIGGKARGLLGLVAAGAIVPPFPVIPTEAFREQPKGGGGPGACGRGEVRGGGAPASFGRGVLAAADGDDVSTAAGDLRAAIEAGDLPAGLRRSLAAGLQSLGGGPDAGG